VNQPRFAIEAADLTRTYPARRGAPSRTALNHASLTIDSGQFVALLGPNGSGKSTLLRILATLDAQDSGSLRLLERTSLAAARRSIGVVFQHEALDGLLTGRENLRTHARLFGLSGRALDEAINRVSAALGVLDRLNDRVSTLSGGLRRRVDLARALLTEPELVFLDEPTTGLDHATRASFLDTLDAVRLRRPFTIVLSTHMMDEASRADRVVMLSEGRIVADGSPAELRASLGGAVLRADNAARETLENAGLTVRDLDSEVVASGDIESVASIARELTRAGIAFAYGPPTLGDVYLARTGRSLSEAAIPETAR
jgi:ABC-2 type transport system ATP-binding protein